MRRLFFILHPFIYLLSFMLPKKKDLWVFGAWFGERYADNSKYLFEEIANSHASVVEVIWITRDKEIMRQLVSQGYKCHIATSPSGIYAQLIAGVFVCSVNSKDFLFSTITPRNIFVQLWHGTPLKKINFDAFNGLQYWLNKVRSILIDQYDYVISPSKLVDVSFMSAFNVSESAILRSAYPRCDGLFIPEVEKLKILKKLQIPSNKKLLLYLPTHRSNGKNKNAIIGYLSDLKSIDAEFSKLGIVLVVKPHFYDAAYLDDGWLTENILVINDGEFDVYELMAVSDSLLTDYSSVMFDYEVTMKPMIFYMPDVDSYVVDERELYYQPLDVVEKFYRSASGLVGELKRISMGSVDERGIKMEFNELSGAGSSRYLANILIKKIIKK